MTATLLAILAVVASSTGYAGFLPTAPGIEVISPDAVLRDHTEPLPQGGIAFHEAGGATVRLITDIEDPEITNRGEGAFFPADEEIIQRALLEIPSEFLAASRGRIFVLPYPRSMRL